MTTAGVILCDDLIFVSKVQGVARAHGFAVVPAKTADAAATHAKAIAAKVVLIDLHTSGLELIPFLAALTADDRRPYVVGFGSHVDKKLLNSARSAGCDLVMPRSQFVSVLEADLPKWLSPPAE
jgi:DNA-binding NarL/FixJ family response regulator